MAQDRYYQLQAVILRARDYKENDKLVSYFSLERGRRTALARGARKPTGSLRGLVQPFTQVNLSFAQGRGSLDIITQGEVEWPFISLRQDLTKIAYASYMTELIEASMPEDKPNREAFMLLLAAFSLLDLDADAALAARFFELRLLAALGLSPHLKDCTTCGRRLVGERFYLSPQQGGVLCATCAAVPEQLLISAGTVRYLQYLLQSELGRLPQLKVGLQSQAELERALTYYLEYHLERASKAHTLLKRLLQE